MRAVLRAALAARRSARPTAMENSEGVFILSDLGGCFFLFRLLTLGRY
jgi:hypothetical protein